MKFKVVVSIDYEVTARNKTDAIRKAEDLFIKEVSESSVGLSEMFYFEAKRK